MWRGIDTTRSLFVANKGQVSLNNVPPGKYRLLRVKTQFLDVHMVAVESGKTTTSEFVRDRGTVVEGRIVGLKEGMFTGYGRLRRPGAS